MFITQSLVVHSRVRLQSEPGGELLGGFKHGW